MKREFRINPACEVRVEGGENQPPTLRGYSALFNSLSEELGGFTEVIRPGAFRNVLAQGPDVASLFNHNPDNILGRTTAGTLTLIEDERGLHMTNPLGKSPLHQNVIEAISRKDVRGQSFSFRVAKDVWRTENGKNIRELHEVGELFDVGPVTYPAYPATGVGVRSAAQSVGLDLDPLLSALVRAERSLPMTGDDYDLIGRAIQRLEDARAKTPHLDDVRRRMRLVESSL